MIAYMPAGVLQRLISIRLSSSVHPTENYAFLTTERSVAMLEFKKLTHKNY